MVNTTKKRTTELEKGIAAALAAYLAAYPDPMSRTDFRKACHISTRISIYPTAERPGALQQYRQAHPLLSGFQDRHDRLPVPPPRRPSPLHPAQ